MFGGRLLRTIPLPMHDHLVQLPHGPHAPCQRWLYHSTLKYPTFYPQPSTAAADGVRALAAVPTTTPAPTTPAPTTTPANIAFNVPSALANTYEPNLIQACQHPGVLLAC